MFNNYYDKKKRTKLKNDLLQKSSKNVIINLCLKMKFDVALVEFLLKLRLVCLW